MLRLCYRSPAAVVPCRYCFYKIYKTLTQAQEIQVALCGLRFCDQVHKIIINKVTRLLNLCPEVILGSDCTKRQVYLLIY